MPTVRIPTQLRSLTHGADELAASGTTVTEVIGDLEARFPGLRARLLDDSGALRRFVNVYVDDEDVRFLDGMATRVASEGRVSIIAAVAGGAA